GIGNEQNAFDRPQKIPDFTGTVVQVSTAVHCGIADQQNPLPVLLHLDRSFLCFHRMRSTTQPKSQRRRHAIIRSSEIFRRIRTASVRAPMPSVQTSINARRASTTAAPAIAPVAAAVTP